MNVYVGNRLPSTYQEVEYIQSSGTQYFVVGASFKTGYKSVLDFQMVTIGGDYIPIGVSELVGSQGRKYGINAYGGYFMVITGGSSWSSTKAEDKNRHMLTINKSSANIDGTNYSISGYTDFTYSKGIGVFAYNDSNGMIQYKASVKIYKLDIYDESGNHIYDLVPCYRKSDDVIGMYDLVNDHFYTNSGTGTFSKGSDVVLCELQNAYIGNGLS